LHVAYCVHKIMPMSNAAQRPPFVLVFIVTPFARRQFFYFISINFCTFDTPCDMNLMK